MNAAGLATPVHADEREGAHGAGAGPADLGSPTRRWTRWRAPRLATTVVVPELADVCLAVPELSEAQCSQLTYIGIPCLACTAVERVARCSLLVRSLLVGSLLAEDAPGDLHRRADRQLLHRSRARGAGGLAGHRRHRAPTDRARVGAEPGRGGLTTAGQGAVSAVGVHLMVWAAISAISASGLWSA